jgi:16S rRNA (guanine966-N2)-methyltransferase
MRITGGTLRGRKLIAPKSASIRPMRDQVRAALFNIINDLASGSRFLDLFAGTGSVGIEALSRGASCAVFVDSAREAVQIIERNLQELGLHDRAKVLQEDVFQALERLHGQGERFDLVFAGPPYGQNLAHPTLEHLGTLDVLQEDAVVATEIFKKERVADRYPSLELFDERAYGDNLLKFYRRSGGR